MFDEKNQIDRFKNRVEQELNPIMEGFNQVLRDNGLDNVTVVELKLAIEFKPPNEVDAGIPTTRQVDARNPTATQKVCVRIDPVTGIVIKVPC